MAAIIIVIPDNRFLTPLRRLIPAGSVLRMIKNFVTEPVWKKALEKYLNDMYVCEIPNSRNDGLSQGH